MPRNPTHAVVWLDFHQAKVFLINVEDVEGQRIKADAPHRQVHHKAQEVGSGHDRDDHKYFEAILAAIENADSWLIVGPGSTKRELEKYLDQHAEDLKKKLVAVEPMDRPTDGELVAQAHRLLQAHPRTGRAMRGGTAKG